MEFFVKNNWNLQRNGKCSTDNKCVYLRSRICEMNDLRLLQYSWTHFVFVPLYKDIFPSFEYKPCYWIIQMWACMSTHGEVRVTTAGVTCMLNCSGFFFVLVKCYCMICLKASKLSYQARYYTSLFTANAWWFKSAESLVGWALHWPSYWVRTGLLAALYQRV